MRMLLNSLSAEWLKTRRSAASWLVIGGAFFVPLIFMAVAIDADPQDLYRQLREEGYWMKQTRYEWRTVAAMLLPLGTVLVASLMAQIEYRNNGWKLTLTTPQPVACVYVAKFLVLLARIAQFILLFHLGIYLSSIFPVLFYRGISYPPHPYPFYEVFRVDALMLMAILPVIALQFTLSIQFRNMFIPLGLGLVLWLTAMIALNWKHIYLDPFVYAPVYFAGAKPPFDVKLCAAVSFMIIFGAGLVAFVGRRDKSG